MVLSNGWLERFIKRHNLSYRRATTTCQKTPADYEKYVVDFIRYVEKLREDEQYAHIYAADETAVWLDMASGKCITEKGAREVAVLTTGHDKMRITVMLTARSDGYKCRPFVLLDRKRPDKEIIERFGQKLVLCWQKTVWMNGECMQQYLQTIFKKNPIAPVKRLLIWDAYRVHLSEATKGYLRSAGVHTAVIPGGCTKYLQAPDVCWNAPFKAKIRAAYEDWMLHGDHQLTAKGNPKPPPMRVYLQWV
ncbi:pogo transposable element with KRAB domain-like protein [Aphelenchoides avenae]|nr:pogo transposable element with KRAB domain-like protein [Aphelenchus avenae]